jgi:hypothetical protein
MPATGSGGISISRDDRTSEFEVEADRHDRVGALGGVGKLAIQGVFKSEATGAAKFRPIG